MVVTFPSPILIWKAVSHCLLRLALVKSKSTAFQRDSTMLDASCGFAMQTGLHVGGTHVPTGACLPRHSKLLACINTSD